MEVDLYAGFKQAWEEYQQPKPGTCPTDANRALLFERFYPKMEKAKDKQAWLQTFSGPCGDKKLLETSLAQRRAMAEATGAQVLYFASEWRFVSGTGSPHPVENGMVWHPTLCVPYLPAAGVKGLALAFAKHWAGWEDGDTGKSADLTRIFGSSEGGAGSVEFYDLLPCKPLHLRVDVMTPHYGDWYAKGGSIAALTESEKIPAPWHNPVPIPFLVVEKAEFTLMLRGRGKKSADDVKCVAELLATALQIAGAGAKTGSGYGRMTHDATRSEREARAAQAERQEREEAKEQAIAAAEKKAQQEQEEHDRREEKARQQAMPVEVKIAALLASLRGKGDKEMATYLTGKKFVAYLEEHNLALDEVKTALWQDAALLVRVRGWSGKKGDEAAAWQKFAPPKKK